MLFIPMIAHGAGAGSSEIAVWLILGMIAVVTIAVVALFARALWRGM